MPKPESVLLEGAAILTTVLSPHGFAFISHGSDIGSGGEYAWGEFGSGTRWLETHFHYSLGLVTYRADDLALGHEAYLKALGVPRGANKYPGFDAEPLDQFRSLAFDLSSFLGEFLTGELRVFRLAAPKEMARLAEEHVIATAGYEGDHRKRATARQAFYVADYARVVSLLESIHYPALLTDSERTMLRMARERSPG